LLCTVAAFVYLPSTFAGLSGSSLASTPGSPAVIAAVAVLIGIVLAGVILWLTGYFTGTEQQAVQDVGKASLTGAATVILAGVSVGFESAVYTAIVIGAAVYGAFLLSGSIIVSLFAVALAGCGLLTTVGVIVAMDTFGPVSDNAQGIAEMSGEVSEEGAKILTDLDAVGQHHQGDHQGHRDRDRRARRDRTVRLVHQRHHHGTGGQGVGRCRGVLRRVRQRAVPGVRRARVQPEHAGRHRAGRRGRVSCSPGSR